MKLTPATRELRPTAATSFPACWAISFRPAWHWTWVRAGLQHSEYPQHDFNLTYQWHLEQAEVQYPHRATRRGCAKAVCIVEVSLVLEACMESDILAFSVGLG